jgi:hypothetical protein
MKRIYFISLSFIFFYCSHKTIIPSLPISEKYTIYRILIDSIYFKNIFNENCNIKHYNVILIDSTVNHNSRMKTFISSLRPILSESERHKNRIKFFNDSIPGYDWEELFNSEILMETKSNAINKSLFYPSNDIVIIQPDSLKAIFKHLDGWNYFYQKYPYSNGFFMVSSIAFNKELNQALIYCEHHYGDVGAEGITLLFIKKGNRWQIEKNLGGWYS